ncbi:MAG: hypothetical protein ACFB20_03815 [Opitutales bacterium]
MPSIARPDYPYLTRFFPDSMAKTSPKLTWCIARFGEDMNWWVQETSDPVRWDIDGLSIVDPRQMQHILDLVDPLREFGFDSEVLESAFFKFAIDKKVDEDSIRLARTKELITESDDQLFGLPDILDEEKGPYADLLDHVTRLRVKLLNDAFDFEQKLTVEELEEELREEQNNNFLEGRATHVFNEICQILEYVPEGFSLDDEEEEEAAPKKKSEPAEDELPDFEDDETIEEDETMRWDEDEDEDEDDEEGESEDSDGDEAKEEAPAPKSRKRK